jgi:hypothetical protein
MDSNEEIMRKAGLRASTGFEGAGASFLNFPNIGWGTIRALPYQEYFVEVDRRQFDNPLSIPRYSSFSVTAEPARFSFIDLPVISGGYVRGTVQLVTRAGQKTGLAGIKVRLRRSAAPGETIPTPFDKTTETFSTGEYEFSGLPPGEYEVSLDRIQLEMLDLSTDVLSREVTVEAKPEGDFIEGINFSLVERNNR